MRSDGSVHLGPALGGPKYRPARPIHRYGEILFTPQVALTFVR
jgi:hypothetical protein